MAVHRLERNLLFFIFYPDEFLCNKTIFEAKLIHALEYIAIYSARDLFACRRPKERSERIEKEATHRLKAGICRAPWNESSEWRDAI